MERVGEELQDLLRRAEVVEEDVVRQSVERPDQLGGDTEISHVSLSVCQV